jgi:RNA polymerase sigma-70 factor (ECF subfamily)
MDHILALPRTEAEAVLLRAVVGLDATAAGKVLGKRPGTVRVAAHRGLKKLATAIRNDRWTAGE